MGRPETVLVVAVLVMGLLFIPWIIGKVAFGRTKPIGELDQLLLQAEYLRSLSAELQQALDSVDRITKRLREVSGEALARYDDFATRVSELSERERAIAEQVEVLRQVPLPALETYSAMLKEEGRSSARRDYLLFFVGVLFTLLATYVFDRVGF